MTLTWAQKNTNWGIPERCMIEPPPPPKKKLSLNLHIPNHMEMGRISGWKHRSRRYDGYSQLALGPIGAATHQIWKVELWFLVRGGERVMILKKRKKNETILCWIKPLVPVPGMNLKKNKNKNEKWCHKIKKLLLKWSHWFTKLLHRDKKNEFESWVCDEFGHERICQYAWSASSYKVEIKTKNQPSVEESACPRHDQTWARGGVATSKSVFNFFFLSLANNSP